MAIVLRWVRVRVPDRERLRIERDDAVGDRDDHRTVRRQRDGADRAAGGLVADDRLGVAGEIHGVDGIDRPPHLPVVDVYSMSLTAIGSVTRAPAGTNGAGFWMSFDGRQSDDVQHAVARDDVHDA